MHLTIAVRNKDVIEGITSHRELKPTAMLSFVAQLTPFSDFNQSPRNMYQCQVCSKWPPPPGGDAGCPSTRC